MRIIFLLGRIIVGIFYIYYGLNHFLKFGSMVEYAQYKSVPLAPIAVAGAGVLLLAAGLFLLLGFLPEVGVAALVMFFIPVTFMMHNFWAVPAEMQAMEMINFTKNMALLGSALMFLMIQKPWPISLAKKRSK